MFSSSHSGPRSASIAVAVGRTSRATPQAALFAAAVFMVGFGLFAYARTAFAIPGVGDIILLSLAWIFQTITQFVGYLLLLVIGALIYVAQYNGFVNSAPVANGWAIVRDITNMFFILVLLVIAFGTILGVDAYSYKNKMLSRLLIMAVVVNFSRTICGLLIDFAQVVMLTFVYGFKEAAGGNFAEAFRITSFMQASTNPSPTEETLNIASIAVSFLLSAVMISIALVVVILMTITLTIRIVYLWLLVVLSPLAFFMKAVPGGTASGYYGKWWKMFTGQVVVGPVMAFFLWLALVSVASGSLATDGFAGSATTGEELAGPVTEGFRGAEIQAFIIAICLLMGGLQISKEISSESAGAAPGLAKKAASLGMRAAKGVASRGAGAADRLSGGRLATSGIPLLSTMAGDRRLELAQKQRAKESRAAQIRETLSPKESAIAADSFAMTAQAKAHKADAQRNMLKQYGDKPPTDPEDIAKMNKWRKDLRQQAEKPGVNQAQSKAILSDLNAFEAKRPSMIIDKNERDPKEIARQEKAFRKSASGFNAAKMADMDADELTESLLAFANPKAIMKAQESASGEQLAKLTAMGKDEDSIRARQAELRTKPENFGLLSENERAQALMAIQADKDKDGNDIDGSRQAKIAALANNAAVRPEHLTGAVAAALADSGEAGIIAKKAAGAFSKSDLLEKDSDGDLTDTPNRLAQQLAAGIGDAGALKNLPKEVGEVLRPLVGARDPKLALEAGASMTEAFKNSGYDAKDGTFANAEGRAAFEKFLGGGAAAAGAVPMSAITKNGGMNDVAISMTNNMSFEQLTNMVENGKGDQAAAILDVAQKLAGASTSPEAMDAFEKANPGLTMNTDQLKAAMTKAAQLTADAADKAIMKQAKAEGALMAKAERNEAKTKEAVERLAREGERFEKKLLGRKKGRRGG